MAPHGTRNAYRQGCTCLPCRSANATDKTRRMAQCQTVLATTAQRHLQQLQKAGVGYRRVAYLTKLAPRAILAIRHGDVETIRKLTEHRILAVSPDQIALGQRIPARASWRHLASLTAEGFTRQDLSTRFGVAKFRLAPTWIRLASALKLRALHRVYLDDRV